MGEGTRLSGQVHDCAVDGCGAIIPQEQLMCRVHWFQVPEPVRNEVWRCWRGLRLKEVDRLAAVKAYKEARRKAIAAVKAA